MQNHRLGIHSDKIWADLTTHNILKIPHNLFGRSAQFTKIFGIFEKKNCFGVSIVRDVDICNSYKMTIKNYNDIKKYFGMICNYFMYLDI